MSRDLRDRDLDELVCAFGSSAAYFHRAAHGEDDRSVRSDRPLKSVGAERTFDRDLTTEAELAAALEPVIDATWLRIERSGTTGRTVTLKVKFADFRIISRSMSRAALITTRADLADAGIALLRTVTPVPQGVRLLGITLSSLTAVGEAETAQPQLELGR